MRQNRRNAEEAAIEPFELPADPAIRPKPSNAVLAALAAPALPMATMTLPLTIFLPAFYASTIGINLAVVGIVFAAVRLADLFFDPLLGGLMDRTRSRWGRFKPWLAAGIPVVMLGAWLLFMARPGDGPLYLVIALILSYAGYSIVILSQMGVGAGLTADYVERSRVFAWWQVFNTAGVILALILPSLLTLFLPVSAEMRIRIMGLTIIIATPVTVSIALLSVKDQERPTAVHNANARDYLDLLALPSVRILLATVMLNGFSLGISGSVFVFFFVTLKAVPITLISLLLAGFTLLGMISAPAWARLGNLIEKHRALALGSLGFATYQALVGFMPPGNLVFLILVFIIGGLSTSTNDLFPRSMMADVNDEDRLRSGADRMGMLYALLALTMKLGQAISIGVVYLILDLLGFNAAAGMANSHLALTGVLLLGSAVPAALYLSAAFCAWRYPLTRQRHDAIRRELQLRHIPPAGAPIAPMALLADGGYAGPLPVTDRLSLDNAPDS